MKAVITCQVPFFEGFGQVSGHQVAALKAHGYQVQAISLRELRINISDYFIKDVVFDSTCALAMWEDASFIHCCANAALAQLYRAKDLGIKGIIERGTLHIAEQDALMKKESVPIPPALVKRQLLEYKKADYITVPSSIAAESFKKHGIENVFMNNLGVDIEQFSPGKKSDDVFRVLSVGIISKQKGHHYLLKAFKEQKKNNAELVLIGGIKEDVKQEMQACKSLYKHIPHIKQSELVEHYRNASVFVLPSVQDGWGMVVSEAQACGIPCIVSENTGAKDMIREGWNGFIIPTGNVKALINKIEYFHNNPSEVKRMGKNARMAAEKFSWNAYEQRYAKFVEESCA